MANVSRRRSIDGHDWLSVGIGGLVLVIGGYVFGGTLTIHGFSSVAILVCLTLPLVGRFCAMGIYSNI